jgi:hypothetical protein
MRIIQLRAYRETRTAIEQAKSQQDIPESEMTEVWAEVRKQRELERFLNA